MTKEELEEEYGKGNVWDTSEVETLFEITFFMAPFCSCIRKSDGRKGTLEFQHSPRFYFHFMPRARD